jgi:hypothetical protein
MSMHMAFGLLRVMKAQIGEVADRLNYLIVLDIGAKQCDVFAHCGLAWRGGFV